MTTFLTEINVDQLPDALNYSPWGNVLTPVFFILMLLVGGICFAGWRYDKLAVKAKRLSEGSRWVRKRLWPVIIVTSILFVAASSAIATGYISKQSTAAAEQKVIEADNLRIREVAQKAIERDLMDRYEIESVSPLSGETNYSNLYDASEPNLSLNPTWTYLGTDTDGVWSVDWITLSLKNDPLLAPQVDVVLRDGNIVIWGVTVDAKSGETRFVNRVEGNTTSISPADVTKSSDIAEADTGK